MKLKKLKEETPKYEGRFWSYSQRKFVGYNEWMEEENPCAYNRESLKTKEEEDTNASESTERLPLDETKER
tara:strand:- start:542 stop:754 length:213 start_codon:yes stop_codon:yes gene_type:complete